MKKIILNICIVLSSCTLLCSNAISTPIFTITPTTPNQAVISTASDTSVVYEVINNTHYDRTLVMKPIAGVKQNTSIANSCTYPFTLAANGGSCLLMLDIIGSQLSRNVFEGPVICKVTSPQNNSPSPFLCAQPNTNNILNIEMSTPYSYITNLGENGGASGGTVTQCRIDTNSNLLTQCADTGIPATSNQIPEDVVFIPGATMAYVVYSDNTGGLNGIIKACRVNENGNLTACFNTSAAPLSRPQALTINATGSIAYIVDAPFGNIPNAPGFLLQCDIDNSTFDLTNCIQTSPPPSPVYKPQDILLNSANTLAYIPNGVDNTASVAKCQIDANTGAITTCADSGAALSGLCQNTANEAIVFNSDETLAYITCTAGYVVKCQIDANNGNLSGCTNSLATPLSYPIGLVFNSANTTAYITDFNGNNTLMCNINSTTGDLNSCTTTGSAFVGPVGIVLR